MGSDSMAIDKNQRNVTKILKFIQTNQSLIKHLLKPVENADEHFVEIKNLYGRIHGRYMEP
jgi:hypothetical protein